LQNALFAGWRRWFAAGLPRARKTKRRSSSPLCLEPLEDRCVPSAVLGPPRFQFQYAWTGSGQQTVQPPAGDYFHKGDKVVIEANVEENQNPDSQSDGDPGLALVVTSPGQTDTRIPANIYDFGAAVITYDDVALDGAPIHATIQNGDGDETGTVNIDDYAAAAGIDINNTADRRGNIVLFNPADTPFGEQFSQTIPVTITNLGHAQATFDLSVDPSSGGDGVLSRSSVALAAGKQVSVTFTPTRDSAAPYDVHILVQQGGTEVASADLTVVSVTFDPRIYNPDTPQKMLDRGAFRIPPRLGTPLPSFTITPALTDQVVTVAVEGQSGAHGTVSINNKAAGTNVDLQSGPLTLTGVGQTEPAQQLLLRRDSVANVSAAAGRNPNALRLHLVIRVGGSDRNHDTVKSKGFAVAAIPLIMTEEKLSDLNIREGGTTLIGLALRVSWESDSGQVADLGQVAIREVVESSPGTGLLAGRIGTEVGGYFVGTETRLGDEHGFPVSEILRQYRRTRVDSGDMLVLQAHEFLDFRMGLVDIPMANSGYLIERDIHVHGQEFFLLTRKIAAAVTANSISSAAGEIANPPAESDQVIPGIRALPGLNTNLLQ
jgi:hypothetical protein